MAKVSNRPWGDFKESDYSEEQYRRACAYVPEGTSSKSEMKLPHHEPDGTLNRNGVHAAAAALAGARGGVQIPADAKRKAAGHIYNHYRNDLDEEPPASLARLAGKPVAAKAS